jgi:hypothetical protein
VPDDDRHHGGEADEIRLALPALGAYGRVARLAVTGLASRNGYSYDDVEDLRIAVGELFGVLVRPESSDQQLSFTCRLSTDRLEVEASRQPPAALTDISDLTRQILAAVTDEVAIDESAGVVRILKRLRDPQ